jgi:transposase
LVRINNKLSKAVAPADAVADASAKEVLLKMKWKVVVVDVDASRANPVVALESTLADTAGELLVRYGR